MPYPRRPPQRVRTSTVAASTVAASTVAAAGVYAAGVYAAAPRDSDSDFEARLHFSSAPRIRLGEDDLVHFLFIPCAGGATLHENLADFAIVGIHERYAESIEELHRTFGWDPPVATPHFNSTPAVNHRQRLSGEERKAVEKTIRFDARLSRFARRLFHARRSRGAARPGFVPIRALPGPL